MANDPIATRYTQALFETVKASGNVDETLEQLHVIGGLLRDSADLRRLMLNPDVESEDKVGVLDRVLQGTWSDVVRAFIRMVVSLGRVE